MVMVVPSCVTMVIVPPIACRSASEMLTWSQTGFNQLHNEQNVDCRTKWMGFVQTSHWEKLYRQANMLTLAVTCYRKPVSPSPGDIGAARYLLLGSVLLRHQGQVLLSHHV